MFKSLGSLVLALGLASGLMAQDPGQGPLECKVTSAGVELHWNIVFVRGIKNWVITRDNQVIATLDPAASSFFDANVARGQHTYTLIALDFDGSAGEMGSCTVDVGGDVGLRCHVEGRQVGLEWGPILIDIAISKFVVTRNGDVIATLPPNQLKYTDTVPTVGDYRYEVTAVTNAAGGGFLVGRCHVTVECFGLDVDVDGLDVSLAWRFPFNAGGIAFPYEFVVVRDGETIARTNKNEYKDTVPAGGEYLYEVWANPTVGLGPSFQIGACRVSVPGSQVPPPEELTCELVRGPFDPAINLPINTVQLKWKNPVAYDRILITRNGDTIATLDGGSTSYRDRLLNGGTFVYRVSGIVKGVSSRPARCTVELPPHPLPPPQDLTCELGAQPLDPNDPRGDDPNVPPGGNRPEPIPFTLILLKWKNPVSYEKIFISRNGMLIASLSGGETSFADRVLGGGSFTYAVVGVAGGARSPAAECTIDVSPNEVPPPQDFRCTLVDVILDPNDPDRNAAGVPQGVPGDPALFRAVVLQWQNPIRYSSLVLSRDGEPLAKLPGDAMLYRDLNPPDGKHVYSLVGVAADGKESPAVRCEVVVGERVPPVESLTCEVVPNDPTTPTKNAVLLSWKNPVAYDSILILKNNGELTKVPGDSTSYTDGGLSPGVYLYEVIGVVGDRRSAPATCQVVIEGPPQRNLLYFSTRLIRQDGINGPDPAVISNRISCLADNSDEVQGWSFGVQSDPKFVIPEKTDLTDTATALFNGGAGPDFLSIQIAPEGVTMAAVISDGAPFETLPPKSGHRLLNIEYGPGPSGAHGEVYPVRYSDGLGDPPVQVLFVVNGFEVRPNTLPGLVSIPGLEFRHGDINSDKLVDISDAVGLLLWLFMEGTKPGCLEGADVNGSHDVNIADSVYLFSYLFGGGPEPVFPFAQCARAPAPLGCETPVCP